MAKQKSTLRVEDLPAGNRGSYILTPKISEETHTHVRDVEKLVQKKAELYGDLYFKLAVCSTGIKFEWGPESDLDAEDLTVVIDTP